MTSGRTIHVSAGCCGIAILLDQLRLTLGFCAQLPEIDVRDPLLPPAVFGSQQQHGRSKDQAL